MDILFAQRPKMASHNMVQKPVAWYLNKSQIEWYGPKESQIESPHQLIAVQQ